MKKVILILALIAHSSLVLSQGQGGSGSGLGDVIGIVGGVADAAELVAITTDVIQATIDTQDKLKDLRDEIKNVEGLLNSPAYAAYGNPQHKNKFLNKLNHKARSVQMYSTILKNSATVLKKVLTDIKETKAGASAIQVVGKVVEKVADTALDKLTGGLLGGGNSDAAAKAVNKLNTDMKGQNLEARLVEFLLKLDAFNQAIDRLYWEVTALKYSVTSYMGLSYFYSIPANSNIRSYAAKKGY
jgi:hypothetical protein